MIELRWLEREVVVKEHVGVGMNLMEYGTTEKILQYRWMENTLEIGLHDAVWSEWQDVPTVLESSDGH